MRQIFRLEADGASDLEKTAKGYITNNLYNACPMTTAKNLTTIATTATKRKRQEAIANMGR